MAKFASVWLVAVLIFVCGCASIEVKRIADPSANVDGIVYYQAELYLLVTIIDSEKSSSSTAANASTQSNTLKYEYKIIPLPNNNKAYAIKHTPGLGSSSMNVSLIDGWMLGSMSQQIDTKTSELLTALVSAGGMLMAQVEPEKPEPITPGLWKIEFDPKTGSVSGFKKVQLFMQQ